MRNKLKIAAVIATVVVGMVLYKNHFDKKEQAEKKSEKKSAKTDNHCWN